MPQNKNTGEFPTHLVCLYFDSRHQVCFALSTARNIDFCASGKNNYEFKLKDLGDLKDMSSQCQQTPLI